VASSRGASKWAAPLAGLLLAGALIVCAWHYRAGLVVPPRETVAADPCDPSVAMEIGVSDPTRSGAAGTPEIYLVVGQSPNGALQVSAGTIHDLEPGRREDGVIGELQLSVRPLSQPVAGPRPRSGPSDREPGYMIRGRVFAPEGPVRMEPDRWPRMLRVRVNAPGYARDCPVDEEGRFKCLGLGAGPYLVSVADLLAPSSFLCEAMQVEVGPQTPTGEVVFRLGPDVPVTVAVLEKDSLQPVRGRTVVAKSMNGPGEASGKTDEQGLCILSLVPGRYWIDSPQGEDGRPTTVDPRFVPVAPAAQDLYVQLLVPAVEQKMVRGILVDAQGRRLKGYVDLDFTVPDTEREPADTFAIVDPGHGGPGNLAGYAYDASGTLARRFVCGQEAWRDGMTVVLEPRAKIVGRLLGDGGRPIPEVGINLQVLLSEAQWRAEDYSLYTLTVGSDGRFRIEGVAVGVTMRVAAHHDGFQAQSALLDLKGGETHDVGDIVLKTSGRTMSMGYVRARVIDEKGRPLARRMITTGAAGTGMSQTDQNGYFSLLSLPTDQPATVTLQVPGYGRWSKEVMAGDPNCTFQVFPQGWDLRGTPAPPLVVDRWVNHVPMTWEQLRGRVVLLMFRDLYRESGPEFSAIRGLCGEYGPQGLVVIAVYPHLPEGGRVDRDRAAELILAAFRGASLAGCLDADPNLVADLAPQARPAEVAKGATYSLYRVSEPPALFLIDKQGKVRCCPQAEDLWEQIGLLVEETTQGS
jgi:hypothetical protein